MKNLIVSRTLDLYYTLPIERQIELTEGASAFIDKYRKAGECREIYFSPT